MIKTPTNDSTHNLHVQTAQTIIHKSELLVHTWDLTSIHNRRCYSNWMDAKFKCFECDAPSTNQYDSTLKLNRIHGNEMQCEIGFVLVSSTICRAILWVEFRNNTSLKFSNFQPKLCTILWQPKRWCIRQMPSCDVPFGQWTCQRRQSAETQSQGKKSCGAVVPSSAITLPSS